MRHRRTINLYDNDPIHEEVLIYLEQFDRARGSQQLLQMALIGFRVLLRQESGAESYFRVRNPDLPELGPKKSRIPATAHQNSSSSRDRKPKDIGLVNVIEVGSSSEPVLQKVNRNENEHPYSGELVKSGDSVRDLEQTSRLTIDPSEDLQDASEDSVLVEHNHEDEFDTLKTLRLLSEKL